MAISDVLREFLVGLSYKVDAPSEKRFKDGLGAATKGVTEFARVASKSMLGFEIASIASFAAVVTGLEKVSGRYEQLYYLSARSGASIKGINEFAYAVSQLGGTAEGARSSLEGVGAFLRSSPGASQVIRNLGIATQVNGHARDTADITTDLIERLHSMPTYQGQRYASMMGIDIQTLNAGVPALRKYEDELDRYYKKFGFNAKQAGDISVEFERTQRRTSMVASVLYEEAATAIEKWLLDTAAPAVQRGLGEMEGYWTKHKDTINTVIDFLTDTSFSKWEADFKKLAPGTEAALEPLLTFFHNDLLKGWQDISKGVSESLMELESDFANVAPNVMGVLKPLTDYFKGDWKKDLHGFGADLASLTKLINDAASGHWKAAASDLAAIYHNDTDSRPDVTAGVANNVTGGRYGAVVGAIRNQFTRPNQKTQDERASAFIASLQGEGLSRGAAIGFAANIGRESSFDTQASNGSHWGIAQWDARRADAILKGTGIDVRTDSSFADQMKAVAWELHGPEARTMRALSGVKDPLDASTLVNHAYERSVMPGGDWTPEDSARRSIALDMAHRYGAGTNSAAGQTITVGAPQTNIVVHGSGDAKATANAVAQKQTQVQSSLVRNLASVAH